MKFGPKRRSSDAVASDSSQHDVVVYFASDIHASTLCWKKFLAAPRFYGATVIIIGGDITGKFLVPIVRLNDDSWKARYHGTDRLLNSKQEVEALIDMAENAGAYAVQIPEDEYRELQGNQDQVDDLFGRLVRERLKQWVEIADERLSGQQVQCFVSGGNDDPFDIDEILSASKTITMPDRQVVNIDDDIEMLSLGYANETPWHCPRDITETDLAQKIDALTSQIRDLGHCVFNIHVPPYDSGLDMVPELDANLNMVRSASGELNFVPVGSTAVRAAIERDQPLLGLHGHVHEGQGIKQVRRTVVVNPGSEYQEGLLRGVLVKIDKRSWKVTAQLMTG
jgi:Icc-related predicted phosphoesterase